MKKSTDNKLIMVDTSQSYLSVCITGKEEDLREVVGKEIATTLGFDGQYVEVALHWGYIDKHGVFQVKPLSELMERKSEKINR